MSKQTSSHVAVAAAAAAAASGSSLSVSKNTLTVESVCGDGGGIGVSGVSITSGISSICSSGSVSPLPIPVIAISPGDESSESEIETEPAKIFHRRVSTKRNVGKSVAIKEGFLLKQTWSFQRWRRRYFRLKRNKLYYAKDPKSDVFDEIDLSDVCTAECSIKNVNHSFQVITPTRSLVLCAETRREMEDWLGSLKSAAIPPRSRGDSFFIEQQEIFANHHHWYATSHARPTYCNVCRDALSGVTSHGLSCEVCKCKVHKRCAAKAIANCKWTTLATVGKDIIEDGDSSIIMPHQWMEGNLPVSAMCAVCKKTCGSVLRLQDWRCLWCRATVHVACRPQMIVACPLGPAKLSVVPPTCVHSIGNDDSWDVASPKGNFSPLLVFVNSKSGDNQGVKFLRRFKQLLNPAQVFDLISTGPSLGLRLFRHFEMFRILVCSGDGSVGWVLSEIDRYSMHKQCQVAVLPLGTGNDLARVLGWGSSCDDDAHLPQILERYESASTKMLDRWSIMVFEKAVSVPSKTPKMSLSSEQEALLTGMVTSANQNLRSIVETDDLHILMLSTKTLCETIDDLLERMCEHRKSDEQLTVKCDILRQKLNMLLDALKEEESGVHNGDDLISTISSIIAQSAPSSPARSASQTSLLNPNISIEKDEKDLLNFEERRNSRSLRCNEREALQSRANSVKRAIYNVVEHSEPGRPKRYQRRLSVTPFEALKIPTATSSDSTPCTSPLPNIPPINIISPTMETSRLTCISPLPDARRESLDDFFNTISLPVPRQFADSRRSSGIPEAIQELEENANGDTNHQTKRLASTGGMNFDKGGYHLSPTDEMVTTPNERNFLTVPIVTNEPRLWDPLSDFRPIEVFERNYYMTRHIQDEKQTSVTTKEMMDNGLEDYEENDFKADKDDACSIQLEVSNVAANPIANNVYTSENITIIDTDGNSDRSHSDELADEASDILSAISNEECSVASEIFDASENHLQQQMPLGDLLQVSKKLESTAFTHIDSPETSDETEAMPGESLMDDISSVLGHDITSALQDSIITDDTVTLCSDTIAGPLTPKPARHKKLSVNLVAQPKRRNSSPPRRTVHIDRTNSDDNPQQFGFENIVFEIDNRCDDQKIREPTRYCSLAQFVEGNDIARQSFKPNEALPPNMQNFKGSRASLLGSTLFNFDHFGLGTDKTGDDKDKDKKDKEKTPTEENKKLPIINPLVKLPNWPNLTGGSGFISKCLLANADTLCAAVSPLMDPDETLLAGYHEKCVMNNYFGIGIDAKISLDFHNKREEHPEKCRSRAKNYMWYGVLGSKQLLQKTCKNLEQRVQLECDGQRIPLPSLQGIVILNIPSFMGGTNFWGNTKKDDIFLTPSFDDRILEVVAVFGSVQMAASRLINLQHHRIAQCQSVQINILGDEEIPIQVDGEAWLQPPGMIRILHKNRVQMLCRNRHLEVSLKSWQEKQRQHSISIQREQSSNASEHAVSTEEVISERECYVLLNFIEAVSSLVKWVKFLIISHPNLRHDLYAVACRAQDALESIHPHGKLLEGPSLRTKLVEVIDSSRQLYDDACHLLRDRGHSLILREDLETKLSAALANMEMELKKCSVQKCVDGKLRAYFNVLAPNEEGDGRRKSKAFWTRLRSGSMVGGQQQLKPGLTNTREAVSNWSVNEVVTWLETMQLSEYVDSFLKNDIRGKELLTLGRRDLKDLGVIKVGHVKRILQAIKDMNEN
ncbi:diacylglycerol kinase eta isoform X6 [Glossina fuscipes]|uniref:Diacylglycerol kinase n=1 Tax=Glossina fuscipes TaxID=7396 RepID=A0A9C5Z3B7_9MUSC|nr:diacylglycerol kinase eta isoform X6 [Glossina fuscipes]